MKLTTQQTEILTRLAKWNWLRDGCLSSPELSRVLGRKAGYWARDKLIALEKHGLVERVGQTFTGADTWRITEAGKALVGDLIGEEA